MPLFIFLSGFVCLSILDCSIKTNTVGNTLKKRAIRLIVPYFVAPLGIIVVMGISAIIKKYKGKPIEIISIIGQYTMDIYILSSFIQPALRVVIYQKLAMNYWLYILLNITLSIIISLLLSKYLLRRFIITRRLLFGMQ
ncbi:MAG: hypothetical protein IJF94_02640 [Eubacterium sp.]|nr:hypothetical protein [Eubacterium sp.]